MYGGITDGQVISGSGEHRQVGPAAGKVRTSPSGGVTTTRRLSQQRKRLEESFQPRPLAATRRNRLPSSGIV